MLKEQSVQSYLDEIASNSPTPGGGNVSAFCGAIAGSLGTMVGNLTVGKKKYAAVETEIHSILSGLQDIRPVFLALADMDNEAFEKVMSAFKLPKETADEKMARASAIDSATLDAARVPKKVIDKCAALLPYLERLSEIGNQNSLSDTIVGISLTATAAEGAFLNVLINCSSLAGNSEAEEISRQAETAYKEIISRANERVTSAIKKLKGTS